MTALLRASRVGVGRRVVDLRREKPVDRLVLRLVPRTRPAVELDDPELELLFVPVDHAVGAPRAAMSEPLVVAVLLGRAESERIAAHALRTRGDRENGLHGLLLEDARAVLADAEVHEHLVELDLVARGGPESGAGGREHVRAVVGTLFHGVLELPRRGRVLAAVVHLDDARELFVGRLEAGRVHAERQEHFLLQVLLPRHAANDLDDRSSNIDTRIGILRFRTRFKENGARRRDRRRLAERSAAGPAAALEVSLLGADFEREAAGVVQNHAHREDVLRLFERLDVVRHAAVHPQRREFGQIFRDGIVERDFAFLDELGDRHAAEALRLRTHHEHVVDRDRTFLRDVGVSDAVDLLDAVVVHDRNRAGELPPFDPRLQRVADDARPGRARPCRRGGNNHQFVHAFSLSLFGLNSKSRVIPSRANNAMVAVSVRRIRLPSE